MILVNQGFLNQFCVIFNLQGQSRKVSKIRHQHPLSLNISNIQKMSPISKFRHQYSLFFNISNMQKMSPISKFCHQHPKIVIKILKLSPYGRFETFSEKNERSLKSFYKNQFSRVHWWLVKWNNTRIDSPNQNGSKIKSSGCLLIILKFTILLH